MTVRGRTEHGVREFLRRADHAIIPGAGETGEGAGAMAAPPIESGTRSGHGRVFTREELEDWQKVFACMPPLTLEIFLLSMVDGLSEREIAHRFGLFRWQVRRHMVRAIRIIDRQRR